MDPFIEKNLRSEAKVALKQANKAWSDFSGYQKSRRTVEFDNCPTTALTEAALQRRCCPLSP